MLVRVHPRRVSRVAILRKVAEGRAAIGREQHGAAVGLPVDLAVQEGPAEVHDIRRARNRHNVVVVPALAGAVVACLRRVHLGEGRGRVSVVASPECRLRVIGWHRGGRIAGAITDVQTRSAAGLTYDIELSTVECIDSDPPVRHITRRENPRERHPVVR